MNEKKNIDIIVFYAITTNIIILIILLETFSFSSSSLKYHFVNTI